MLTSEKQTIKHKGTRHAEYYDMVNVMDKLYEDSKNGRIFKNLMNIITSENNIKLAFRNIKKNSGSMTCGTDKLNIKNIEKWDDEKLVNTIRNKLEWYKPKPVKRVEIPKPDGKMRPLGIPTIIDRLIQQCILQVIEPICEAKFYNHSYGFRPNRSTEHAIARCYQLINLSKLHHVVDVDIKGFFDNVNHAKLRKQIWSLGIQDKRLLCIISEMLKAPIELPNGQRIIPNKGTPQGGILSPLLANIVLNELDWWIASQWEDIPTKNEFKNRVNKNGSIVKSDIYRSLRKLSNLKEMHIVRYADDFKIFCRKPKDAFKIFNATKLWLNERLHLDINEEKSKVINLRRNYSDYLGVKIKAVPKGNKLVVQSHISDKALAKEKKNLKDQIKRIAFPKNEIERYRSINKYNAMVIGIHNYYQIATHINIDVNHLGKQINDMLKNRLHGCRLTKDGVIPNCYIKQHYGNSKQIRFCNGHPIVPIGYIQCKKPMCKRVNVNRYTKEGRKAIHKKLEVNRSIMRRLMSSESKNRSIEYIDNRISLYVAQHGKCRITGIDLEYDDLHCHHIIPVQHGGGDNYHNLVIVHKDVHILIHATNPETINSYLQKLQLNKKMLFKLNGFREKVGITPIN